VDLPRQNLVVEQPTREGKAAHKRCQQGRNQAGKNKGNSSSPHRKP